MGLFKDLAVRVGRIFAASVVLAMVAGCGVDPVDMSGIAVSRSAITSADATVYPLAMGATDLQVGEVRIWNDADTLYVQFVTFPGYELADAHVCASLSPLTWQPPGQCPYKLDPMPPGTTEWTFSFPLSDLGEWACGVPVYLQAHASIAAAGTGEKVGSAYGGTFKGQVAYDLSCEPEDPGDGCTRTQGYWKTHPREWPVGSLTLGGAGYSQRDLIGILKTPPRGDASMILAKQLIATLLNVEAGASVPGEVADAIAEAQLWMSANADADGLLPYSVRPGPEDGPNPLAWDDGIALGALLDLYNNGEYGPPHCE